MREQFGEKVQLAGRNAISKTLFNALAIADTNFYASTLGTWLSNVRNAELIIVNTLNQQVTLSFVDSSGSGIKGLNLGTFYYLQVSIPAEPRTFSITGDADKHWSILNKPSDYNFKFQLNCTVAPTSGSVSIYLKGEPLI
jgi:hypothetical protein